MLFDPLFGGAEFGPILLIEQAGTDKGKDFALARSKSLISFSTWPDALNGAKAYEYY